MCISYKAKYVKKTIRCYVQEPLGRGAYCDSTVCTDLSQIIERKERIGKLIKQRVPNLLHSHISAPLSFRNMSSQITFVFVVQLLCNFFCLAFRVHNLNFIKCKTLNDFQCPIYAPKNHRYLDDDTTATSSTIL